MKSSYKIYSLLFVVTLFLGCEVRVRNQDDGSILSRASRDTSAAFRISSRSNRDSQRDPLNITDLETRTTINSQVISPSSNLYEITTPLGNMRIRLYDETPIHRDNFIKMVESGFYDGTTFHRVIGNYIIQGGDPNSKDGDPSNDGLGGPGYTNNAEFAPSLFHKRGALAAARQPDQVNPQRRSSGSQFYIVLGRTYAAQELLEAEKYVGSQIRNPNFRFSTEATDVYTRIGGIPHLDMQYTVFGELVDGFDVLDRIGATSTDGRDRPTENIAMSIRALPAQ